MERADRRPRLQRDAGLDNGRRLARQPRAGVGVGRSGRSALIDPVLLLAVMCGLVWWAFGWRVLAVALVWWGTNYPARYTYIGGAFLREDWLLLASRRSVSRNAAGWRHRALRSHGSALLRVFPGIRRSWAHAAGSRPRVAAATLRLPAVYWRFAAGGHPRVAAVDPAVASKSLPASGGLASWRGFVAEQPQASGDTTDEQRRPADAALLRSRHEEQNVRELWLDSPWDVWKDARTRVFGERRWLQIVIVGIFLALLAAAVRDREPWIALVMGLGTIPCSRTSPATTTDS